MVDAPIMSKEMSDKAQAAADKAAADKATADAANADKVLGDMEKGIGDKLRSMHDGMSEEFSKVHAAMLDMPDEVKAHHAYLPLSEKISSVEALLVTLGITAATFPAPEKPKA